MGTRFVSGLAVAVAVVGLALPAAIANQVQVGYSGAGYGPYQTGLGGEFTLNDLNPEGWLDLSGYASVTKNFGPTGITSFQTFCLEGGEYLYPYSTTYDAVVNTKALYGGVGPSGDALSAGTGWLYQQFATGVWEGSLSYSYAGGNATEIAARKDSAGKFQDTIWWLEGEEGKTYDASNPYMKAVVDKFGSEANAKADGGSTYGVYALNLTVPGTGGRAQDQLYYKVPDGGMTVALLGMGLAGVGFFARRRTQS